MSYLLGAPLFLAPFVYAAYAAQSCEGCWDGSVNHPVLGGIAIAGLALAVLGYYLQNAEA